MKVFLFALMGLLTVALTACEVQEEEKDPKGVKNVTDYSMCKGSGIGRSIENTWEIYQKQGEFDFKTTYDIRRTFLYVTNECKMNGITLRATVNVGSTYDQSNLSVLQSANNKQESTANGLGVSCEVNVKAAAMAYAFQGPCLVLTNSDGKQMLLIPRTQTSEDISTEEAM